MSAKVTLRIKNVQLENAGQYKCNPHSLESFDFNVIEYSGKSINRNNNEMYEQDITLTDSHSMWSTNAKSTTRNTFLISNEDNNDNDKFLDIDGFKTIPKRIEDGVRNNQQSHHHHNHHHSTNQSSRVTHTPISIQRPQQLDSNSTPNLSTNTLETLVAGDHVLNVDQLTTPSSIKGVKKSKIKNILIIGERR